MFIDVGDCTSESFSYYAMPCGFEAAIHEGFYTWVGWRYVWRFNHVGLFSVIGCL